MELEDFRVRVLDRSVGTGAVVRVLIDMSNGEREWTTVGVSENIIEASWEALVDGYTTACCTRGARGGLAVRAIRGRPGRERRAGT